MAIPVGELQFAGGGNGAVDGGQEQVLADGDALAALGGKDGIEQLDQIQTLRDIEQGSDVGESSHLGFERLGWMLGALGGSHEVVDFAEIDLADDLRLAVDALAITGVVIGVAADQFGGEARHA